MRHIQQHPYDYVIRTRTDLYLPFQMLSLPDPPPRNVAFVGFVGQRCNRNSAWWTDDRFAILPTAHVYKAYMFGFAHDFCKRPCHGESCSAPECKLGWTLATRNITPLDVRRLSPLPVSPHIIRGSCENETTGNQWLHSWSKAPISINATMLQRLVTQTVRQLPARAQERVMEAL